MKKIYVASLLVLFCFALKAQPTFQKYLSTSSNLIIEAVGLCTDGSQLAAGEINQGSAPPIEMGIMKTDSVGNLLWSYKFTLDLYISFRGVSEVGECIHGGYYALARIYNENTDHYDYLLLHLDSNGQLMWWNFYTINWDDYDIAVNPHLKQDSKGYYYISIPLKTQFISVLKISEAGSLLWARRISGTGLLLQGNEAYNLELTNDDQIIVAGTGVNLYLVDLDSTGTVQWTKDYNFSSFGLLPFGITKTGSGNFIIVGPRGIMKINSQGDFIWFKKMTYGSWLGGVLYQIIPANNNYLIYGRLSDQTSYTCNLLMLIDSNGNFLNAVKLGNVNSNYPFLNLKGIYSGFVLAGTNLGQSIFSRVDYNLLNICNSDTVILNNVPVTSVTITQPLLIDNSGSSYAMGLIETPILIQLSDICNVTNIETQSSSPFFSISPNPTTSQLLIRCSFNETGSPATLSIHNTLGEIMHEEKAEGSETTIDVSSLPSGIYLLEVKTKDGAAVEKFVKD